jgi:hypothetical protein
MRSTAVFNRKKNAKIRVPKRSLRETLGILAHRKTADGVRVFLARILAPACAPEQPLIHEAQRKLLERFVALFTRPDTDSLLDGHDKNLAVTDFSGTRGFEQCFDNAINHGIRNNHLDTDFG